jgi:peptidoglycan/LPS O-acetylase OafA/YrhL
MNTKTTISSRRYDLDWLRVLVILTVFIFHTSRFFDLEDWHIKNAGQYLGVQIYIVFLSSWMMPLIFAISGASLFYALGKAGSRQGIVKFIQDKVLRLLVPLVVGACTHASLQVYLDRLTHGQFSGSYFEFLPHYYNGLQGFGGNFAWTGMHLWYLLVLFLYSLLFLPLFRWLKDGSGRSLLSGLGEFLARPGATFLLALPTILMLNLIDPDSPLGDWENGGWHYLVYITFFLGGFLVVSHDGLQRRIQAQRRLALIVGAVLILADFALWGGNDPVYGSLRFSLIYSIFGLCSWCLILAILGFGMKHLNFSTPFLKYANEAVLPFYVLHQTVLLGVGYFVVQWAVPDLAKFVIIGTVALALIMGLYEFAIRRVNILRALFGMKPLPKVVQAQAEAMIPVK